MELFTQRDNQTRINYLLFFSEDEEEDEEDEDDEDDDDFEDDEEDEDDEEEDWLLDVRVCALYITIQLPYRTKTFHMAVRQNTTTTSSIFSSNREKKRTNE